MNYLLFFITSVFSFIFFIFYKLSNWINIFSWKIIEKTYFSSFFWNLFIESIIFLILAIFLFIYFSSFNFFIKKEQKENIKEQDNTSPIIPSNKGNDIKKESIYNKINIRKIFADYIYYIGFIFFYISIYLILYSFWITEFNYLILFLNLIIFVFFFLSHKATLFKDFIKINTILFSLYYIFIYLYIFISWENTLNNIDFINTLFIFSFFIINFYWDYKKIKQKTLSTEGDSPLNNIKIYTDNSLVLYFFIYSFIVFSFYFRLIFVDYFNFIDINFSLIFIYISVFLNIIIYFILQKIVFFQNSKYILRALSFLFWYISIIFSTIFLIKNIDSEFITTFFSVLNNFLIIWILIYLMLFNFRVHKYFQNYISLFFSLFSSIFLLNFILYKNILLLWWNTTNLILILNFSISFFIVIFTYIYPQKFKFDYFFLHICAYLVNIMWITYYLFFWNFEILNIWIILLLDSILIFLSYFKLKILEKEVL